MAEANPRRIAGLVLLSSYLGEPGPTARRLVQLGSQFAGVIPRDLRNAVREIQDQPAQLARVRGALAHLAAPVHVVHGDADDFAPIEAARALTELRGSRRPVRFQAVSGANHFLNDGPVETLLECIEGCIPKAPKASAWRWPQWVRGFGGLGEALPAT
jgi:pimeloyl-ACP methyl ester carboxylesterase